jgi:uncharacterized protein (TIGR02145 family)
MDFINVNSKIFPLITVISPNFASIGETITIKGKNFGYKQDTNYVTIYGKNAIEYVSWENDKIKVKIPPLDEVPDVKTIVTVNGVKSNEVDIFINNEWTIINLDVDNYRNGDPIPQIQDSVQWANLKTGAWCYYDNDSATGAIYGKLYNWYAVKDIRKLAPKGWHIPISDEWRNLTFIYHDECYAGGYLKETGTIHWLSPNVGATNQKGFIALPGGFRYYDGTFYNLGYEGNWWSVSESEKTSAWNRTLYCLWEGIDKGIHNKKSGFSVRCLRYK